MENKKRLDKEKRLLKESHLVLCPHCRWTIESKSRRVKINCSSCGKPVINKAYDGSDLDE